MRENLSYVFFKELTGPGPLGALNVALTPRGSVATDPNYVPLGAPDLPPQGRSAAKSTACGSRRMSAARSRAPTGSTPSGAPGPEAVAIAGGMSASGEALILVPKGVAARALAQP